MNYKYINTNTKVDNVEQIDKFYQELVSNASYSDLIINKQSFVDDTVSLNDLTFRSHDGANIYAKYVYPKNMPITKVLLLFHGYHVASGAWFDKIAMAKFGIAVLAMDSRGHSGKSVDIVQTAGSTMKGLIIKGIHEGHQNLYMPKLYMDTYIMSLIAKDLHPDCKLICSGESLGGALALACASLSNNVDLCITQYPYLCDIKEAYNMGKGYAGLEDYFRWEDPTLETYNNIFDQLSYIDLKNMVHNVNAPVTMFVGNKDQVCPPQCMFSMYNKLTVPKNHFIYHEYGHEYLQGAEDKKLELILSL
ncbi:acetylxylan esterase [Mollicutes bacterium LVI A0039]|nr:acetylxylan esterase [Mollicutes bacterium LVI A0039]